MNIFAYFQFKHENKFITNKKRHNQVIIFVTSSHVQTKKQKNETRKKFHLLPRKKNKIKFLLKKKEFSLYIHSTMLQYCL